jgi:glycosyltransferase involved in cell wall biosynthesis
MPFAIEQLDLSGFDLVISSNHAVAKGVRVPPGVPHLCYCHSPMRYAWDLRETYLQASGMHRGMRGWVARRLLDRLQRWDRQSATSVTQFVANSHFVASRIRMAYGRESRVVYPPVDTEFFTPDASVPRSHHYLAASRLVGYKRIPLLVEAFRHLPDRELIVIGDGEDRERVRNAAGPNVTVLGHVTRDELRHQLRQARALLFAAEEDFGILPVEAMACGTPVIALAKGGARETVTAETGVFFEEPTVPSIVSAIQAFEAGDQPAERACRANAERFATSRFHHEMRHALATMHVS